MEQLVEELNVVIEGLIRYGDRDLILSIINFLTTHHMSVKGRAEATLDTLGYCNQVLEAVHAVNDGLEARIRAGGETESDP